MADQDSSALGKARTLIEDRLRELEDERRRLEQALKSLGGLNRRAAGPRRSSSGATTSGPGRRRRKTRADQALAAVQKSPGITAGEIAKQLKVKPTYLYRVMAELVEQGKVTKDGRSYKPA